MEAQATDGLMTAAYLKANAKLDPGKLAKMADVCVRENISLSTLAQLKRNDLESLFGLDTLDRARIVGLLEDKSALFAPSPADYQVVRAKIGITNLSEVNTGLSEVPEGTWRPMNIYLSNQQGTIPAQYHLQKPVFVDLVDGVSSKGTLLWPSYYEGILRNPMSLNNFPFDSDVMDIWVHQAEDQSSKEFVMRPFDDPDEEKCSVRFFFDVEETVPEFYVRGFSKCCWESIGGIPRPFSHCLVSLHVSRKWAHYAWKIVLPLLICTGFCFSAFFFEHDDLEARNNVSLTMFLATCALLYVVASDVPKTGYLTSIDKLIVSNLTIQALIGASSWAVFVAFPIPSADADATTQA